MRGSFGVFSLAFWAQRLSDFLGTGDTILHFSCVDWNRFKNGGVTRVTGSC